MPSAIQQIKSILINNPLITSAFIYGSYLETDDFNDIDVGIFIKDKLDSKDRFDLEFRLSKLIANQLAEKREIDVKVLNEAPYSFLFNVFQGRYLFSRDDKIEDLMERVICKCLDEQYLKDRYLLQAYC